MFKIVITGDTGVGKTTLLKRFHDGLFVPSNSPTLGLGTLNKTIKVNEEFIRLKCIDFAGSRYYSRFRPSFYSGSQGALLVFDISSHRSFEELDHWLRELKNGITQDIPIILVGNKADVGNNMRVISTNQINAFSQPRHLTFYEVSAKDGINVEAIFYDLTWRMIDKIKPIFQNGAFKFFLDQPLIKQLIVKTLKILPTSFCPLCGSKGLFSGINRQSKDFRLICLNCKNQIH
ncbi:MAG: Rab family GTPase [Candidatus Hermodarchaeota archaeon]